MAAQRQRKAELIAIYRLEFYKKQKNWKLSSDARKEEKRRNSSPTVPIKTSKILNETYSIETHADKNDSILNDAFVKDESDKDIPVSPTTQISLHTQCLEPINACQVCQHADIKPQNPWADYVDDGWAGPNVDRCSGDGNDFEGFDGWVEGMVWTNSGIPQCGWTGDVPAPLDIRAVDCPEELVWAADNMLYQQLEQLDQLTPWPDDQLWVPDIWGEEELLVESLESVDQFMLGAHSAPHSSEMELCAGKHCTEGEGKELHGNTGALGHMSEAALSAAVRRHASSLRQLLREAGQRQRYKSSLSVDVCAPEREGRALRDFFSSDYSYDAFPTKDNPSQVPPFYLCEDDFTPLAVTNLCKDDFTTLSPSEPFNEAMNPLLPANRRKSAYTPLCPANLCRDGFLAGSHRNRVALDFIGRGRGRLQEDRGGQA